jgi:hypothetical protein
MDSEDGKAYKEAQQDRRAERLPIRQAQIEACSHLFTVKKLTEYQYRINGEVDVYPIHNRYHVLKTGKRGGYRSIAEFLIKHFGGTNG